MEQAPESLESSRIMHRLGAAALHHNCDCPLSWRRVVVPQEDGTFAYIGRHNHTLEAEITDQMRELYPDGGGGVAPYESTLVNKRRDTALSLKLALWTSGIRELSDGSIQDGLFAYPFDPIPPRKPERF